MAPTLRRRPTVGCAGPVRPAGRQRLLWTTPHRGFRRPAGRRGRFRFRAGRPV